MSDARPPISAALRAFGLPGQVTPPGEDAYEATVIWLPPVTADQPTGREFGRAEPRRVLALYVENGVTSLPIGTVVVAAEFLGTQAASWKVDQAERIDPEHWRMTVVPA